MVVSEDGKENGRRRQEVQFGCTSKASMLFSEFLAVFEEIWKPGSRADAAQQNQGFPTDRAVRCEMSNSASRFFYCFDLAVKLNFLVSCPEIPGLGTTTTPFSRAVISHRWLFSLGKKPTEQNRLNIKKENKTGRYFTIIFCVKILLGRPGCKFLVFHIC